MKASQVFDVSGKVAFVTGAGAGLGRAMACTLAENGARVVCFDRDAQGLARTVEGLGGQGLGICGDVTDGEAVKHAVAQTVQDFGRLDIAIANAGVSDADSKLLHEADEADWHRVVSVNLSGVYATNRAALHHMMAQGHGKVINVASMWGLVGPAGLFPRPAYSATKGAVVNLTRELGLEYAKHGIQVNALCPGFFRTETRPRDAEHARIMQDYTPMGRIAEADEIAGAVLFLASSASDFVTGTALVVDGGVLAR